MVEPRLIEEARAAIVTLTDGEWRLPVDVPDILTRLCAALEARAHEGWVLVPKEPTPEMIAAAATTEWSIVQPAKRAILYRAMIAAAPSSPSARDVVPTDEVRKPFVVNRSKEWWLALAAAEGVSPVSVGSPLAQLYEDAYGVYVNAMEGTRDREKAVKAIVDFVLRARPAPDAAPAQEGMGRFGHHPDPAIDFCVEVEELTSIATDREVRVVNGDDSTLEPRVDRAMKFVVGGDQHAVAAKSALRKIEESLKSAALPSAPTPGMGEPTDAQIKHMVDRFLNWRLPKPWNPDKGISYQRPNFMHAPADHDWPSGTNLFDAQQAEAMVRYMLGEEIPAAQDSLAGLIAGFPWDGIDPDEAMAKCEAAEKAGLLAMENTEPGSPDEHEYGQYVYRLTDKGRALTGDGARRASPAEPSELDIVQGALTLRIAQVQGLKEDNALLATVARRAESCLNTVKNDFAREKLESALAALPKRLRTRDDYPARPAPDAVDLAEGVASAARDLYLAGRWECATVPASEQVRLWERLRDAAGIEPGTATKAGVAATTAAPAEGGGE